MVWRGVRLTLLLGLLLSAPIAGSKAAPTEPVLQLELKDAAEEEALAEEELQAKETQSIPEPSFAAAFMAGTGMLLTLNYLRRRGRH